MIKGNQELAFGTLRDDLVLGVEKQTNSLTGIENSRARRFVSREKRRAIENPDQVRLFDITSKADAPLNEIHNVEPKLKGSEEKPDVKLSVELASFHPSRELSETENTERATLRLDLGQDEMSDTMLRPVFYAIAAGLDFKAALDKGKEASTHYRADFKKSFSNRPVEIGGGLCQLGFEVVAHKEKPWWRKLFTFLETPTGKALTSAIGFPAVASEGLKFIDDAINEFIQDHKTVFRSAPIRLALSERALDDFTFGGDVVDLGVLNPGYNLLVAARDYSRIFDSRPRFLGSYGAMVPSEMSEQQFLTSADPFADITYAVLRVKSSETSVSL